MIWKNIELLLPFVPIHELLADISNNIRNNAVTAFNHDVRTL